MSIFGTILIPVDLSERHEKALELAGELAALHKGEIVLLHVIEAISGATIEEEKDFYGRLEKSSWKQLEKLGRQLDQRQVRWRANVLYGNRGQAILGAARDMKADLIVLTAPHIEPGQLGTGLGSLSFKISLFSPCPVLLVK